MNKAGLAILSVLLLTSAVGGAVVAISYEAAKDHSEPRVNYSFHPSCNDHATRTGFLQECWADVDVHSASDDVEYVEVIVSADGIGASESWVVVPPEKPLKVGPSAFADRWGVDEKTGEVYRPFYRDWVTVQAVTSDGRVHVLEQHRFSCEDVSYKDACKEEQGQQPGGR